MEPTILNLARARLCSATIVAAILLGCVETVPLINRLPAIADSSAAIPDSSAVVADSSAGIDDSSAAIADYSAAVKPAGLGSGPFGIATLVAAVSHPSGAEDPSFTQDERELYFMSSRSGGVHIWVSRRAAMTDPWGVPQRVIELDSNASDEGPCVARDGLTIWFGSDRDNDAGTGRDIWVSSRARQSDPWGVPRRATELASSGTDTKPSVDDAELVMVFMSNRAGGVGGLDIYSSTRAIKSGPWGPPVNLGEVNTTGDEWDPFIGGQDLHLFWATNFPAAEAIQWGSRVSVTDRFSAFQALSELGTPASDPTLSVDLRHIMFASSRSGTQQIYEAFR